MKEQIRQLRVEIDGLHQLTLKLKPIVDGAKLHNMMMYHIPSSNLMYHNAAEKYKDQFNQIKDKCSSNSREIEQTAEKLIFAKAWLGKVLGEMKEETPYKNDGNRKTEEDIEPTADVNNGILDQLEYYDSPWEDKTHIERVDWLREKIKYIANTILEMEEGKLNSRIWTDHMHELKMFCYQYLSEARFWLGFELQRIKKE